MLNFLISCSNNNIPYLIYFDSEKVLYLNDNETGILNSRIRIPQDFPEHNNYISYGQGELQKTNFKLKQNIEIFEDSIVTIFDVNNSGCMKVEPRGKLKNGILFLDYKFNSKGCKEEEIYRLKYVV